jgi:SAM-dependent methyltransferase
MLKMFHDYQSAGSSSAYWESMWGDLEPATYANDARRHCEASPLWSLVTGKVQRDRLFIDGGCGHGYWVKCLHDRGQKAAGVDFAERTLEQIRRIDSSLDVRQGDVRALPFGDGEVHVYYSGGVVEHFEEGPTAALREARRVIAPDGWFLCSVPDVSPLRKHLLYRAATEVHGVRNGPLFVQRASRTNLDRSCDASGGSPKFFQYAFEESEFRDLLRLSGFTVVETFGESFVWGFLEIDPVRHLHDRAMDVWRHWRRPDRNSKEHRMTGSVDEVNGSQGAWRSLRTLPRRALMNEDRSIAVLGGAVGLAAEFAANLRMYVARPSAGAASLGQIPPRH